MADFKWRAILAYAILPIVPVFAGDDNVGRFDAGRDLFLPQFDSKTDVDDLHSVAGVATMLRSPLLDGVEFHAVAGAYGVQEGLYVPAPELFEAAFGANWSDAHNNRDEALERVAGLAGETLVRGGSVWVAEAGQSDFTADWLARVEAMDLPVPAKERVHVVQHSDWNESVTDPAKLAFVRQHATYHRIPDGNVEGNGTPGFNTPDDRHWPAVLADPASGDAWRLARGTANAYNGVEARYLNASIEAGGMDFSDVAESCWIFGYEHLEDAGAFFETFGVR